MNNDIETSTRFSSMKNHFWGRFMGFGLLAIGIAFYLYWSILYNTWRDVGVTSFVIVLVVFGVLELLLVQAKISEENAKN
ncbi:MAG: hypothetical protein M1166_06775 [Candidatus Thermoplasmatota archaeon]|jgi:NADH:ubiquinone oxidoreductase subunit 3 (subunit A)|nr:hypothetical protein [Candidatus Thermoplasmatota archaeon]